METEFGNLLAPNDFEYPFCKIIQDVDADCHAMYDGQQEQMDEKHKRRQFKVLLVDSDTIDAFATSTEDSDFVVIHRGLIEHIYGTFFGLFSTPEFLPSIGNAQAEAQEIELIEGWLPRMPLLRNDNSEQAVRVYVPIDLSRQGAAIMMSGLAVEYLLFHEVGHIACGHLDMANGYHCCQPRFRIAANDERKMIATRLCECDADAYAGHASSTVTLLHVIDEKLYQELNCPSWSKEELGIVAYVTAVAVLFRILDNDETAEPTSEEDDHPHPAVRCCFVLSSALARAVTAKKLTPARASEISFATIRNIEHVWAQLKLPGQRTFSPETFGSRIAKGMWEMFAKYQAISAEFSRFARVPRRWCDWEPLPVN